MTNRNITIRKVIGNIGLKQIFAIFISLVLSGAAIYFMGNALYNSTRDKLLLQSEMNVNESTDRFNNYLAADKNALIIAGYTVNNFLMKDVTNDRILRYMTEQTEGLTGAIDKSFTGLYGYIGGDYLDGSGWTPDEDYVPTERPWYKAAMESPHEIVFVDPYVDSQTGDMMITLAELLDDGESVIALDIGLSGVQKITEDIAAGTFGTISMVLDGSNVAIAHSDRSEIGKNYSRDSEFADSLGGMIVQEIDNRGEEDVKQFTLSYKGRSYLILEKDIEGGWHSISAIDTAVFYRPLINVILLMIALAVVAVLLILFIFYRVSRRELMNQNLALQIGAVADIYDAMIDINLVDSTYYDIDQKDYSGSLSMMHDKAQDYVYDRMKQLVDPSMHSLMKEFLDLSTLPKRLHDRNTLAVEYLDPGDRWCRGRFIVAERSADKKVTRVIWATETIDDEKRQKEALRQRAETDLMTGLYNRVSGESRIKTLLDQGRGGMFVLFDIDHFKEYNDTFGHNVGDKVIGAVATCLKKSFRDNDVVMRLGGDEFAVFAPSVRDRDSADMIMDRFFDNLANIEIKEADSQITVSAGAAFSPDDYNVTTSYTGSGMTGLGTVPMTFHDLYQAADTAMYQSKRDPSRQITYAE